MTLDDTPLSELLKPLSAKVEPKRPTWANERLGSRGDEAVSSRTRARQQAGSIRASKLRRLNSA